MKKTIKKTTVKKEPSMVSNLKKEVLELNEKLLESERNASYYKGRYEESAKKRDEEESRFTRQIEMKREEIFRYDGEVVYLRELVKQLTLSPEKLAAMKANMPDDPTRRNY